MPAFAGMTYCCHFTGPNPEHPTTIYRSSSTHRPMRSQIILRLPPKQPLGLLIRETTVGRIRKNAENLTTGRHHRQIDLHGTPHSLRGVAPGDEMRMIELPVLPFVVSKDVKQEH